MIMYVQTTPAHLARVIGRHVDTVDLRDITAFDFCTIPGLRQQVRFRLCSITNKLTSSAFKLLLVLGLTPVNQLAVTNFPDDSCISSNLILGPPQRHPAHQLADLRLRRPPLQWQLTKTPSFLLTQA
jgi:hypothetical protein